MCRSCRRLNKTKDNFDARRRYARSWTLKKKYGIDSEDFETIWIAFYGKCGICNKKLQRPEQRQGQGLDTVAVDHDHLTGNIRGLLCSACNKGIGFLKDDPILLEKAAEWCK